MTHSAGSIIADRYVLECQLGQGGMGSVWQARHTTLGSQVAIKFLHRRATSKPVLRKRFFNEAQVMARLQTRRVVSVFDFGFTTSGTPYLIMELVDGENLNQMRKRHIRLDERTTLRVLSHAARALECAHGQGVIHRDFKPDNILLSVDEDGDLQAQVADFGVATLGGYLDDGSRAGDGLPAGGERLTKGVVGTPAYMAPEQLDSSQPADARSDIWSFGVVAYECLTGVQPFTGRDVATLLRRLHAGAYAKPTTRVPHLPPAFDDWFARCCAVDPGQRYPNIRIAAFALATALGRISNMDSVHGLGPMADAQRGRELTPEPVTLARLRRAAPSPSASSSWGDLASVGPTDRALAPTLDLSYLSSPRRHRHWWRKLARSRVTTALLAGLLGAATLGVVQISQRTEAPLPARPTPASKRALDHRAAPTASHEKREGSRAARGAAARPCAPASTPRAGHHAANPATNPHRAPRRVGPTDQPVSEPLPTEVTAANYRALPAAYIPEGPSLLPLTENPYRAKLRALSHERDHTPKAPKLGPSSHGMRRRGAHFLRRCQQISHIYSTGKIVHPTSCHRQIF